MNIWTSLKRLIILSWGYGIVMMRLKDGFYMELEMKHINVYSITDHEDKRGWEIDSAKAMKEKAMAPHSSIFAWKIPWLEEAGRLQSMGSLRVGHDWSDLATAAAAAEQWLKLLFAEKHRLSFIEPIFAWNVPLVSLIFLKRSLVFPILLFSSMLGASVRNSAHGKGHEEGSLAYAKMWSSLRKPPFPSIYPQNQSPLRGALPHNRFSQRRS